MQAQQTIVANVLKHTYALCEALRQNYITYCIKGHQRSMANGDHVAYHKASIDDLKTGNYGYNFYPETGRKYHKIIMETESGSRSVHAFVDKKTGEVYKSASWKAPAKGVRYDLRLISDREWLFENADWSGGYLYLK